MTRSSDTSRVTQAMATASDLRVLVGKLKRRLREEGGYAGLSLSQRVVLGHLYREDAQTVSELARIEKLRPQSMGATVASLQAAGLIAVEPDPRDGRRSLLSLTSHAREYVETSRAARDDWLLRTISEHFTPDEQDALARGVALLKRLADY